MNVSQTYFFWFKMKSYFMQPGQLVATLINFVVILHYVEGIKSCIASVISLSILVGLAILWFILENFIIKRYTEDIFTAYITLMIGNAGIFEVNKKPS